MPQALEIDHNEVRVIALQIGVREAARQMGLPEATVQYWSANEHWFAHRALQDAKIEAAKLEKRVAQGLQPVPTKAVDVLANYSGETRLNHAKYAHRTSKIIAHLPKKELLMNAPTALAAVKHASETHNWRQVQVNVGIRLDEIAKMQLSVDLPQECEDTES